MFDLKHTGSRLMGVISALFLTACSSVVPVSEVMSDRTAYLDKSFSRPLLVPEVAKKVAIVPVERKFGSAVLSITVSTEHSDGRKESYKNAQTLVDKGDNFIQILNEFRRNDIPSTLAYALTFKSLFDLRWQTVPLRNATSGPLYSVREIKRFADFPSGAGGEFLVEYASGPDFQIANFPTSTISCKATKEMFASEVHKNFTGKAFELDCELLGNGVLQHKSKKVFLQSYGFAVTKEIVRAANKTSFTLDDVVITP